MQLRHIVQAPALTVPDRARLWWPIVVGFAGWFIALGIYKLTGFTTLIAVLFCGSVAVVGWGFSLQQTRRRLRLRIGRGDLLAVALLLSLFAPLYLVELYQLPYPVHNDEVHLMVLESELTQPGTDWFGVSQYLSMPIFLFSFFGWLGKALGGIGLTTMRAVHAGLGLLIILASYALFRSAASRLVAFGAAGVVGINHSLWMLSRMALWDNSAVLFQTVALAILLYGLKRDSLAMAFAGGVAAGLSFYVYLPARAVIAIWALFILALAFYFRTLVWRRSLLSLSTASLVGCLMIIMPLTVTNTNRTADEHTSEYRFLITPAGLEHQRLHALGSKGQEQWTTLEAYLLNVEYGLTAFNNREWDGGGMYTNPDHGFVDPLTGILLWIGLGAIAIGWRDGQRPMLGELLCVVGFLSLWLALAFLVNQAPNYTRMLGVLPFVGYLTARGLDRLASTPRRLIGARIEVLSFSLRSAIFLVGLLAIGLVNLSIVGDYITFAWEDGSVRGATARYVEARKHQADYSYHLYADFERPYYTWGDEWVWHEWIAFFTSQGQQVELEPPENCADLGMNIPFTAFMSAAVWQECQQAMLEEYTKAQVHYMRPDRSRLAIEVLDD